MLDRLSSRQRYHVENAIEMASNRHGQRRPIVRDYVYRQLGRLTPSFTIESDGARFVLSTADQEVSRILFIFGFYDRPLLEQVHEVLGRVTGRPFDLHGKAFLDIGANIGSATVEALVHFGAARGVAFEPAPENLRYLQQNLAANDLLGRVEVHPVALSDRSGEVPFELAPENWGDHRVRFGSSREGQWGERDRATTTVEAVTLDELVDADRVNLDDVGLAWIDVQGHEPNTLAGATSLTGRDIPVVIEYWAYGLRDAGALDRMDEVIAAAYPWFVDVRAERLEPRATSQLADLHERYAEPSNHTDLVLLPDALVRRA